MARLRSRSVFLVERYWPGVTLGDVERAAARTVAATASSGMPVTYLGSALIEDEETVFSLFDGPDADAIEAANRGGEFRYDRIRPVLMHPQHGVRGGPPQGQHVLDGDR